MQRRLMLFSISVAALVSCTGTAASGDRAGVTAFNDAWAQATRKMDNVATMALWAQDGVSLLPSTQAIVGKPAIEQFMTAVTKSLAGATMESFAMRCYDIVVSGSNASEWCLEHQVVNLPSGKAKFDGWGKMLVVLRHEDDGKWRMIREMWNPAVPDSSLAAAPGP